MRTGMKEKKGKLSSEKQFDKCEKPNQSLIAP